MSTDGLIHKVDWHIGSMIAASGLTPGQMHAALVAYVDMLLAARARTLTQSGRGHVGKVRALDNAVGAAAETVASIGAAFMPHDDAVKIIDIVLEEATPCVLGDECDATTVHLASLLTAATTPTTFTTATAPVADDDDLFAPIAAPRVRDRSQWVDTTQPPIKTPPLHLSVSQIQTYLACPLQYRLKYLEEGVPEVPAWWFVGGQAIHAAIESLERAAHIEGGWNEPNTRSIIADIENDPRRWTKHLDTVVGHEIATSGVDVEQWRAAKNGAEDWRWWAANGHDMLKRYINNRNPSWRVATDDVGMPMLEYEFLIPIAGVPVKGFIDQVFYVPRRTQRYDYESILIRDPKSGAGAPKDGFQLDVYTAIIETLMGGSLNPLAGVESSYYMTRTGNEAMHADRRANRDSVEATVRQVRANIDAGHLDAPPSSPCWSCSVRHACPNG